VRCIQGIYATLKHLRLEAEVKRAFCYADSACLSPQRFGEGPFGVGGGVVDASEFGDR
jgi:hypothetical protein